MKIKKIIAISAIITPISALAAIYGGGPAEGWTGEQITQQANTVSANIISWGEGFAGQMENHFEQVISAIAVATKQESIAANLIASNNLKTSQQLVNAVATQQKASEIAEIISKYSPQTGQGYKTCVVIQKNKTLDRAFSDTHLAAQAYVAKLDNAPGVLVDSVSNSMSARYKNHLSNFCTDAEDAAGLCKKSKLPGGDMNAAVLFAPAQPESLEDKAQMAYIQNLLGKPDGKLTKSAGASASGQDYLYHKARKDALISIPAYSLARIKAANTINPETGYSTNQLLERRTTDYFGGPEATKWSKVLAGQDQRGLMVETLKVGGLQVWLDFQHLKQTQRINANLAALILVGSDTIKSDLDSAYYEVRQNSVSNGIQ